MVDVNTIHCIASLCPNKKIAKRKYVFLEYSSSHIAKEKNVTNLQHLIKIIMINILILNYFT